MLLIFYFLFSVFRFIKRMKKVISLLGVRIVMVFMLLIEPKLLNISCQRHLVCFFFQYFCIFLSSHFGF